MKYLSRSLPFRTNCNHFGLILKDKMSNKKNCNLQLRKITKLLTLKLQLKYLTITKLTNSKMIN